jgi:hypothetical protein
MYMSEASAKIKNQIFILENGLSFSRVDMHTYTSYSRLQIYKKNGIDLIVI